MVPSAHPGSVTPVGQAGHYDKIVPGESSLLAVILIASGIIMTLQSAFGVDVGYISQQVKGRPVYLLKKKPEKYV